MKSFSGAGKRGETYNAEFKDRYSQERNMLPSGIELVDVLSGIGTV